MTIAFRSFAEQARHYFDRPHSGVPGAGVSSRADWRGSEMRAAASRWLWELTAAEVDELEHAADGARHSNIAMSALSKATFVLPTLAARLSAWREDIRAGRGFVVIRGLPVARWGDDLSAYVYWGIGHHLGMPGAQNPQGELLGHVVDYDEEQSNPLVRRYRTSGNIDFHCDAADAVGLLCLRAAKAGGQSRIVSAIAIFNAIARAEPGLIARLFEPFALDRRGENRPSQPGCTWIAPCTWTRETGLRTFYHSEYFRSAERLEGVQIDVQARRLLDLYDSYAASPEYHLDMWLEPGDMQFISNHTLLHARTRYEDWPDAAHKRHLLRLWLSLEDPAAP